MLILAFETSAKAVSVALHDGGVLLAESYQNTGLTHSQTLMSMAQGLLKNCRRSRSTASPHWSPWQDPWGSAMDWSVPAWMPGGHRCTMPCSG